MQWVLSLALVGGTGWFVCSRTYQEDVTPVPFRRRMAAFYRIALAELTVAGRYLSSAAAAIGAAADAGARQAAAAIPPLARRTCSGVVASLRTLQAWLRHAAMLTGTAGSLVPVPRTRPRDRVLAAVKLVLLVATLGVGIAGATVAAAVRISQMGT
jgi:hypothetical protein